LFSLVQVLNSLIGLTTGRRQRNINGRPSSVLRDVTKIPLLRHRRWPIYSRRTRACIQHSSGRRRVTWRLQRLCDVTAPARLRTN